MKTLKLFAVGFALAILFSSCLKEKISYDENGINQQYNKLDQLFTEYTIVEIDNDKILDYSKEKHHEEFVLDLQIPNKPNWVFSVNFHDFFKPEYKSFISDVNGNWVEDVRTDRSDAYHGQSKDLKSRAMFIMEDDLFTGNIFDQDKEYFMEPLNRFVEHTAPNLYVYYPLEADIAGKDAKCGNTNENILNTEGREIDNSEGNRASCREMSIMYTADNQFYTERGNNSVTSSRNYVENRLRYASYRYWGYNKYPLYFWLFRSYIRTSTGNPPTQSSNHQSAIYQWKTYANKYIKTGDCNILFTGRSFDVPISGTAYPSTVCKYSNGKRRAFAMVRMKNGVSSGLYNKTTAHEVGHTLGAYHTSTGFMKLGGYASSMSSTTKTQLNNYISSNNSCMPYRNCVKYK